MVVGDLSAPVRAIGGAWRRLRLTAGVTAKLVPIRHISLRQLSARDTEWIMTGDDPSLLLVSPRALPPGHYRLVLGMSDDSGNLSRARIYPDLGHGFDERTSVGLALHRRARGLQADFALAAGATTLRLDPGDRPGRLRVKRVSVRKLTRTEYYATLAIRRLKAARNRSVSVFSLAHRIFRVVRAEGLRGIAARLHAGHEAATPPENYDRWIVEVENLSSEKLTDLQRSVEKLPGKPLISVLMPVYNTPERLLREAIESVRHQIYQNWELCIADDCSTAPGVCKVLEEYAARDPRIRVVYRRENGHISKASNSALELVSGEWVALLDHDDLLRPHALAEVALEIGRHPDAELIYSDEDKIDLHGRRYEPYFKPDFSRELFRSQNYLNHLTVHRADNIRAVGGWRTGFEGSQDYDLNLRIFERIEMGKIRHIPKVLYHWRAVEGSTATAGCEKGYAYGAGLRALEEHVARMKLPATVEPAPDTPFYRLKFAVPEPQPLVSLIIPTRDRLDLVRGCVDSILQKTTYRNYEIIIVDNGSVEPETLAWFETLKSTPNVRVLPYCRPFNYSAINNFAVGEADGEIVGLVNNDIEVISPDWLTEMVSWAIQPDVGCVGAKLYYPNDTIQHAGVILGIGGVANHAHLGAPRNSPGYFGRAVVTSNWSAVTGACLLVRASIYREVGGLDETNLAIAFNDVDFCLRVREGGYMNVWTPYAELYHHESASRGREESPAGRTRFASEVAHMTRTWGGHLRSDPYYSRNLNCSRADFLLES